MWQRCKGVRNCISDSWLPSSPAFLGQSPVQKGFHFHCRCADSQTWTRDRPSFHGIRVVSQDTRTAMLTTHANPQFGSMRERLDTARTFHTLSNQWSGSRSKLHHIQWPVPPFKGLSGTHDVLPTLYSDRVIFTLFCNCSCVLPFCYLSRYTRRHLSTRLS